MERKSYSIDINRIAQYAMYAYCIFALFSLAFSVCRQAGLSFRTSPILIPISPILVTIKQLVLQLAPIALWGIFRCTLPAGVKLLRRCSEVMVFYYVLSFILGQCFNLHLVTMMQNGQITQMASILTWTESTMGLISVIASLVAGCHLCSIKRIKNILRCYAAGIGIKETASTFHISRNTVRKYVRLFLSSGKSIEQLLIWYS